jgi:hypothetical protein
VGGSGPTELREAFEGKARAELAAADALAPGSDIVGWRGCLVPVVAVVKGYPGPAEASGGPAVSGADGEAISKALERLGYDSSQVFYTLSRPAPDVGAEQREARLRAQIEAVDAPLVIALDREAAQDLAHAYGASAPPPGVAVRIAGRRFVACDGLESALGTADATVKARLWEQLTAAAPEPPVF